MPNVLKSGSLILQKPPEPVQVCNGIAVHFLLLRFTVPNFIKPGNRSPQCCDSTYSFLLRISLARTAATILKSTLIFKIVIFCPRNILAFSVDHKISINYIKISPITGPRCPKGSRKLRFPDYVKMVQNGGKVVSLTHRPFLPPGNTPGTHFC